MHTMNNPTTNTIVNLSQNSFTADNSAKETLRSEIDPALKAQESNLTSSQSTPKPSEKAFSVPAQSYTAKLDNKRSRSNIHSMEQEHSDIEEDNFSLDIQEIQENAPRNRSMNLQPRRNSSKGMNATRIRALEDQMTKVISVTSQQAAQFNHMMQQFNALNQRQSEGARRLEELTELLSESLNKAEHAENRLDAQFSQGFNSLQQGLKDLRVQAEGTKGRLELVQQIAERAEAHAGRSEAHTRQQQQPTHSKTQQIPVPTPAAPPEQMETSSGAKFSIEAALAQTMGVKQYLETKSKISHETPAVSNLNFEYMLKQIKEYQLKGHIKSYILGERITKITTFIETHERSELTFEQWDIFLGPEIVCIYTSLFTNKNTAARIKAELHHIRSGVIVAPNEQRKISSYNQPRKNKTQTNAQKGANRKKD